MSVSLEQPDSAMARSNSRRIISRTDLTFDNSKIVSLRRWGKEGPGPEGTVMTGAFQLDGREFMALNGGPHFKFTEAISLFVSCKTQEEVDALWEKLSEGGSVQQCGWLKASMGSRGKSSPPLSVRCWTTLIPTGRKG